MGYKKKLKSNLSHILFSFVHIMKNLWGLKQFKLLFIYTNVYSTNTAFVRLKLNVKSAKTFRVFRYL